MQGNFISRVVFERVVCGLWGGVTHYDLPTHVREGSCRLRNQKMSELSNMTSFKLSLSEISNQSHGQLSLGSDFLFSLNELLNTPICINIFPAQKRGFLSC